MWRAMAVVAVALCATGRVRSSTTIATGVAIAGFETVVPGRNAFPKCGGDGDWVSWNQTFARLDADAVAPRGSWLASPTTVLPGYGWDFAESARGIIATATSRTSIYSQQTNTYVLRAQVGAVWTRVFENTQPIRSFAGVGAFGDFFVLGGGTYGFSSNEEDDIFLADATTLAVVETRNMSQMRARRVFMSAYDGGGLVVAGGDFAQTADVRSAAGTWSSIPLDTVALRAGASFACVGTSLFVFGGFYPYNAALGGYLGEVYNVIVVRGLDSTPTVSTRAMLTGSSYALAAVSGASVVLLGGRNYLDPNSNSRARIFDTLSLTETTHPSVLPADWDATAACASSAGTWIYTFNEGAIGYALAVGVSGTTGLNAGVPTTAVANATAVAPVSSATRVDANRTVGMWTSLVGFVAFGYMLP